MSGVGTEVLCGAEKQRTKPQVKVVAVEPADSLFSGAIPAPTKSMYWSRIYTTYNGSVVDRIIPVSNDYAILTSRKLAKLEGLLVGISSGAAAYAALQLAKEPENSGKTIVAILPDTGERYLSTLLYAFDEYPL